MAIRSKFEKELERLSLDIIKLGSLVESAMKGSVDAISSCDKVTAERVINNDNEINSLTSKIERVALNALLTQQPVAKDLRVIISSLKITTDLRRIGDQARDICEIVLYLSKEKYQQIGNLIYEMAQITLKMVSVSIDSFAKQDAELSKKVIIMDNEVDEMFVKIRENMIDLLKTNVNLAYEAIYLMMVAKYLEKSGDHAENIADWVIFAETGILKKVKLI